MLTLQEKNERYLKYYDGTIKKYEKYLIELRQNGFLSDKSLAGEKRLTDNLKKAKNTLFKKMGEPAIVDFSIDDYDTRKYNSRYIVSKSEHYLNIWRKTGNGLFGSPVQISLNYLHPDNIFSNMYLLDLSELELLKFYDVSNDECFVVYIESHFKGSKKALGNIKKSLNKLLNAP